MCARFLALVEAAAADLSEQKPWGEATHGREICTGGVGRERKQLEDHVGLSLRGPNFIWVKMLGFDPDTSFQLSRDHDPNLVPNVPKKFTPLRTGNLKLSIHVPRTMFRVPTYRELL